MKHRPEIVIGHAGKTATIPNDWHRLTPEQYLQLQELIMRFSSGELPAGMVKVLYLCSVMGWDPSKIKDYEAQCNLAALSDQITFIFNIVYPDSVKEAFDPEEIAPFCKVEPIRSTSAVAKYLSKTEYHFALESCFCAQLVPEILVDSLRYQAYTINTDFNQLTTTLTASQYLDARQLTDADKSTLPLLAAILYFPGEYDSHKAHELAVSFAELPTSLLSAIAFNFISFNNFLFKKTEFSLLTASEKKSESTLSVGPEDALYNLSVDGYGDITQVKKMNLIEYLKICRKKTIDSIRSMHQAKMPIQDIASESGLPFNIINEIIK